MGMGMGPRDRGGTREDKKLSQLAVKDSVKVTQEQMWFNLIAARTSPEKEDEQPNWSTCGKP